MGIPMLAKTITRKYPNIIDHNKPRCSRLFLDLNCAIHTCTNNILTQKQNILPEALEVNIAQHTIEYIHKIVSFSEPEELLYIAIDGIPPRAKMSQQRKRRYVSSWKNGLINAKRKESNVVFTQWDTNAITPGTTFMNNLATVLHDYFDDPTKHKLPVSVILSDSNEKGEGEAKILDYIKGTPIPPATDIIYGLDADLIMLGLLSSKNEIFLLREPAHYNIKVTKPFLYFNIPLLRKYISVECSPESANPEEYSENTVWDYVALCFILGNDFLPPLSYLKIKFNGIEMLVEMYKRVREETGSHFVMKDGDKFALNYIFMLKFLEHLKSTEDASMCEAEQNYYNRTQTQYMGKMSPVDRLSSEIDNYPMLNKFPNKIQPQKSGWRLNYYYHLFKITEINEINDVCLNYLEGIEWTFNYYFAKCFSHDWYYRYEYSPTILDLYNFILINLQDTDTFLRTSIDKNYPAITYDTDLQLLLVLPPASRTLIKPHLRPVMDNIDLGCVHFYPNQFGIGTYLKLYLWECAPILPLIDVQSIQEVKTALELTKLELTVPELTVPELTKPEHSC